MGFWRLSAPRHCEPSVVCVGIFWEKDPELSDSQRGTLCKRKRGYGSIFLGLFLLSEVLSDCLRMRRLAHNVWEHQEPLKAHPQLGTNPRTDCRIHFFTSSVMRIWNHCEAKYQSDRCQYPWYLLLSVWPSEVMFSLIVNLPKEQHVWGWPAAFLPPTQALRSCPQVQEFTSKGTVSQ